MKRSSIMGLAILTICLAGCGGSKTRTVEGIAISLMNVERGNVMKEGYSTVTASKGREIVRLVFLFKGKGKPIEETITKLKKWKVRLFDRAGNECGPMNGWVFVDRYASKIRVYSDCLPLGTQMGSVTIGAAKFPLSGY